MTLTSCDAGSETRPALIDMARTCYGSFKFDFTCGVYALRHLLRGVVILIVLGIAGLIVAIVSIARPFPPMPPETDVFGFAAEREKSSATEMQPLQQFRARDGDVLAYRFYDAASERILIFIHGSSYHGGGYHELATSVSAAGAAKVVLVNMRGHYFSGRRRGDIE